MPPPNKLRDKPDGIMDHGFECKLNFDSLGVGAGVVDNSFVDPKPDNRSVKDDSGVLPTDKILSDP